MGCPRRAVISCAVLVALLVADLLVRPGGDDVTVAVDDLAQLLAALTAVGAGWWRTRRSAGRAHTSWLLFTVGATLWSVGAAIWLYLDAFVGGEPPLASVADTFFLSFSVLAAAGLLIRPSRAFAGRGRLRIALDATLIAASLFTVSWVTVLERVYADGSTSSVGSVVNLAYPVGDLALLTVVIVVLAYSRNGTRSALAVIAVGLVCFAVADSAYAYLTTNGSYRTGSLIDVGWVAGFLLLAWGAAHDAEAHESVRGATVPARSVLLLPYLPVSIAAVVGGWRLGTVPQDRVILLTGIATLWMLIARGAVVLLDNRLLLERMVHQARHDALTGLANGVQFNDRLAHAVDLRRRNPRALRVLLIDLDDFKTVNDTFGHAAGDELLSLVGERLRDCIRRSDTAARLGGDEFGVLIEDTSDGIEVAERILTALADPVMIGLGRRRGPIALGCSIGVAVVSAHDWPPSATDLLHRADLAMYAAKSAGKRTVRIYSADLGDTESGKADLLAALAVDLAAGDISVVFQPIRRIDGGIYGYEALPRWSHGTETVSPAEFLPIARRIGSVPILDGHVLRAALAQAATWDPELVVAVNLGGETLADPSLAASVAAMLEQAKVSPQRLTVEVREAGVVDGSEPAVRTVDELRALGVRIAVDGFGHTSFTGLRNLRPDIIKVDSSLTGGDDRAPVTTALLAGVTHLAHDLGALVIAEGIETDTQLAVANAAGCDALQGYLVGVPAPAEDLADDPRPEVVERATGIEPA